jgi:hypothetical protein
MKGTFLFAAMLVSLTLISCGKDKFKTNPQIEIKDINHKTLARDEQLVIRLRFTDKEGDLAQGKLVYIPVRLNIRPLPVVVPDYDSVKLVIPNFPNEKDGEFALELSWLNLHKSDLENDTIKMRFVAVDRENNKSDTITSDRIVILKN